MKELLRKLRKYEIRIRKIINSQRQGDFRSIFKGTGLEFEGVRPYQYGDDVRSIDWNVTAKGHGTFVKTFIEEKEQTVFFILDVSGSQEIGSPGKQKLDIGREICGVLALSSIKELSQVGLLCFSDQKEIYVRPSKGSRQAYQIISKLYNLKRLSLKTDLDKAIRFTLNTIKRKSVIIFISDFIDEGYEKNLKALAKKHDLVLIHITDKRESKLPKLGIIPILDKENNQTIWVNSSSPVFRSQLAKTYYDNSQELQKLANRTETTYLQIQTDEDFVSKLIKLFKVRNKMQKIG